MAINTRTLAEMQAEMASDEATGWVRVSLWQHNIAKNATRYFILKNRTVIREYTVEWEGSKPTVTDVPSEYTDVGNTFTAKELKSRGYKRMPGTRMFNEVTRELATI